MAHLLCWCCFVAMLAGGRAFLPPSSQQVHRNNLAISGWFGGGMSESDQRKEEDFQKQQEILRNRRDPNYNKKYMAEVKQRRTEASKNVAQKFNLGKGGNDPVVKWLELRKAGIIGEREKYEKFGETGKGETNRGIIIPQVPFGKNAYDEGLRFDLRLPYVDEGYVDKEASFGATLRRLFGGGKVKPTEFGTRDTQQSENGKGKTKKNR